jgi:hypothetical protein
MATPKKPLNPLPKRSAMTTMTTLMTTPKPGKKVDDDDDDFDEDIPWMMTWVGLTRDPYDDEDDD